MKIYTAITKRRDSLRFQPLIPGVQYVAYTDEHYHAEPWKKIPIESTLMAAKRLKIIPPLDDEYTVWIDGSMIILPGVTKDSLISLLGDCDIATFKHCERYCVYQEAVHCIAIGVGDRGKIFEQITRYAKEGLPRGSQLYESPVIIRRNTNQVREFSEMWLAEVSGGQTRDQISFPYCVWKTGIKVAAIPGDVRLFGNQIAERVR